MIIVLLYIISIIDAREDSSSRRRLRRWFSPDSDVCDRKRAEKACHIIGCDCVGSRTRNDRSSSYNAYIKECVDTMCDNKELCDDNGYNNLFVACYKYVYDVEAEIKDVCDSYCYVSPPQSPQSPESPEPEPESPETETETPIIVIPPPPKDKPETETTTEEPVIVTEAPPIDTTQEPETVTVTEAPVTETTPVTVTEEPVTITVTEEPPQPPPATPEPTETQPDTVQVKTATEVPQPEPEPEPEPEPSDKFTIGIDDVCNSQDSRVIRLSQNSFNDGTVRISTSNRAVILSEDIVFNPDANRNNPNDIGSYFPVDDDNFPGSQQNRQFGQFKLGWFAALSIETNNIEVNLCGHTIEMDREFRLQQRFFAAIEVGNAPFFASDGPWFVIQDANQVHVNMVSISNGVIGLSSHHGIHGNGPTDVWIEDLIIKDFEVAGIHLNGFERVKIRNVEIGPSSTDVPSNGFYSHATILVMPLNRLSNSIGTITEISFSDDRTKTINDIFEDLIDSMDSFFFQSLGLSDTSDATASERVAAKALFDNPRGLPDGAAIYGIVLHSRGEATGGFGAAAGESTEAILENVVVHDIKLNTKEFAGYKYVGGLKSVQASGNDIDGFATGPYGDAIDVRSIINEDADEDWSDRVDELTFKGNPLIDGQIALGIFGTSGSHTGRTMQINDDFIDWATGNGEPLQGSVSCNQDAMRHLNKGIIGIRIEETNEVSLTNVEVRNLDNVGEMGTLFCGSYTGPNNGGHEAQANFRGYMAADTRGISIFGSRDVNFESIIIDGITAANGNAKAIDIIQDSDVDFGEECEISNVIAGFGLSASDLADFSDSDNPNEIPEGCGVNIRQSGNQVDGEENCSESDINGPDLC